MTTTSPHNSGRFGLRLLSSARVLSAVLAMAALAVPTQSYAGSLVYHFTGHNATQSVDMSITVNDQATGNDFSSYGTLMTNYRSPTGANCYVISGSYKIKDLSSGAVVVSSTFNTNPVYTTSEFRVGYGMGGGWPNPVGGPNYRDLGTHFLIAQEFNDYGDLSQAVGAFWEANPSWNTGGALPTSFLAPPNEIGVGSMTAGFTNMFTVDTATVGVPQTLPTQTLTILGGYGNVGAAAPNVEYFNPSTQQWQPAFLADKRPQAPGVEHDWGVLPGTNHWINYKSSLISDSGAGPTANQTLWYLYRVRFTVPSDAVNPHMSFSLKADNFAVVAINGAATGGSTQFINNAYVNNVIVGQVNQVNADAVFSQAVHTGENTITLNIGDWGGLNGFNFRIDLSMQSSQPLEIVPATPPDTTPPVITAPVSVTKEAAGSSGANVSFVVSATDDVDGSLPVTATPGSGSLFPLGTTSVKLSATDAAGNKATGSFPVNVVDTTPPTVTAPADINREATGPLTTVSYTASATDLVDGSVAVTASPASGSGFAVGTTNVKLSATDAHNNTGKATFNVTITDATPPTITSISGNLTPEATSAAGATVTYAAASATDLVTASPAISYSKASGSVFPIGTTTVTVTATDAAGNSSQRSFTVTVRDTTAPALASVTPSSATLWPPNHQMVAIKVNAVATDLVGVASLKIIGVTSSEPDNGLGDGDTAGDIQITGDLTVNLRAERAGSGPGRTYTITVEARDAAGNASTKTCTVSVPKSQGGK